MKSVVRYLTTLATTTTALLGSWTLTTSALAAQFSQQEIDPNRVIAVAAPVDNGSAHQLLILEQISNQRDCWQEQDSGNGLTVVQPLLLNFDFTGICGRSTDSNGYSLRIGGEDMNWRYQLSVVQRQNDLVLFAVPVGDRRLPTVEIGRANGFTNDFAEIKLNPGWRMARRVYNGRALGHIYLTTDQNLDSLIAAGPSPGPVASPRPTTPAPTQPRLPDPPTNRPVPTLPVPTTPSPTTPGVYYRVIVPASSALVEARVKSVVPQAFRTTVNGQSVMQVGLFNERDRADSLQQQLNRSNLSAQILQESGTIATPPPQPTPTTPTRPNPSPTLPQVPRGRMVVMIDPGHGGRDPGAVGIGGLREKDINFAIASRVAQLLEQQGVQALMTRSDDRELDLDPRVRLAERANANLFVSIHANSISLSRPDVNGLETYYHQTGAGLARSIHNSILRSSNIRDRGVRQANFYVIRYTSMPAVLVETGFVTGREDVARFNNVAERDRMADAIAQGILDYLRRGA